MAIDSEDSGGCSAAVAISHADDAKSKISLNAAATLAKIAGKNFFKLMKSPQIKKLAANVKFPAENGFEGDFSAHLTKSNILDFYKVLNGVMTRNSQKTLRIGLETSWKILYTG